VGNRPDRPDWSGERGTAEREVEFCRLLWFSRLLLLSVLAGDFAEGELCRGGLSVDGFRLLFHNRWGLLLVFGFQSHSIFISQDAEAAQVILGVNVFGMFLLAFFSRAFLFCGFCDVLSVAIRCAEENAGEEKNARHEEAKTAQQVPTL
jgi:hypothetical protein